jgi:hypothetical protein
MLAHGETRNRHPGDFFEDVGEPVHVALTADVTSREDAQKTALSCTAGVRPLWSSVLPDRHYSNAGNTRRPG